MTPATSPFCPGPHPLVRWIFSSIGKKSIVALTGLVLVAFVTGHLIGNFTIYLGPDCLNAYARRLADLGPVLWVIRFALIDVVILHIFFTMLLWKENQAARPQKYRVADPIRTTIFARTMRLSGLIVLAFVIFHLAHFTARVVGPVPAQVETMVDGHKAHDVYAMVVTGFRSAPIVLVYVVGLFLLTMHLSHGLGSLFQTLGVTDQKMRPVLESVARATAWLLFLGYVSIPVSVFVFGLGKGIVK